MFQILNIASHNLFSFEDLNISEVLTIFDTPNPDSFVQGVAERSWPWVPCQRPAVKEPKVKWSCAVLEYGLAPLRCFETFSSRRYEREKWGDCDSL